MSDGRRMGAMLACLGAALLSGASALAQDQSTSPADRPAADGKARAAGAEEKSRTAIFAGGCFWCVEKDFERAPGVLDVVSGYSGGTTRNPTYKTYMHGRHREVIQVVYDPRKITYAGLVEFLLKHSNPVDRGGSFIDRGVHYSPAIYYADDDEKRAAEEVIKIMSAMKVFRGRISIPVLPRTEFWPAEEYHQDFHTKNPQAYAEYRARCGRDAFIQRHWGDKADELTLPGSFPPGAGPNR